MGFDPFEMGILYTRFDSLPSLSNLFELFVNSRFEVQFAAFATHFDWDIVNIGQLFSIMERYTPDGFFNYSVTEFANFFIHSSLRSRA